VNVDTLSVRLRELRGRRSQSQIEIQTGVKQRTLSGWENDPPEYFSNLVELARYYAVSTDYLLGLTDDPRPLADEQALREEGEPYQTTRLLTDEERALLIFFNSLDEDERAFVFKLLDFVQRRSTPRIIE
jgi:transcriptional regulator with XRE-family HTH domain